MRFSVATLLALASAVAAQTSGFDAITTPAKDQKVPAGSTFEIDWQPGLVTGTVSIILLGGTSPNTLEILSTIASNVTNTDGKYEWAVASTLGSLATYGLKIQLDADPTTFQYSFPFEITGGSPSSASGSASGSGSATATATATASGSTTMAPTTSTSVTTVVVTSTSAPANLSITAVPTKTLTTVVGGSSSSTTASAVHTGAAATAGAGTMALLGGLALAALAL